MKLLCENKIYELVNINDNNFFSVFVFVQVLEMEMEKIFHLR